MDHKHFQSVKRLFGEICKSKPMNQVTRYKQVQVSAKIMLEQKADVLNPKVNWIISFYENIYTVSKTSLHEFHNKYSAMSGIFKTLKNLVSKGR